MPLSSYTDKYEKSTLKYDRDTHHCDIPKAYLWSSSVFLVTEHGLHSCVHNYLGNKPDES